MKVAVFGFYNALNYGDDRLQHCLTKLLRRQANTVVFLPHNIKTPLSYINTFDWIIIGGGGLVFEEVGIWENLSKWLK